jgi:PEP-CTERM motif
MRLLSLVAVVCALSVPGWSSLLYSNGAVNGTIFDTPVFHQREATDSFVLLSDATVTGVSNIGLWTNTGDTLNTLSWVISTATDGGGTVLASATAIVPTLVPFGINGTHTIYSAGFSVSSLALTAGTYYLELLGGATTSDALVGWDEINGGASIADANTLTGGSATSIPSESFEIDGLQAVPEPATAGMLGAGLGILAWRLRRFRRQGAAVMTDVR